MKRTSQSPRKRQAYMDDPTFITGEDRHLLKIFDLDCRNLALKYPKHPEYSWAFYEMLIDQKRQREEVVLKRICSEPCHESSCQVCIQMIRMNEID